MAHELLLNNIARHIALSAEEQRVLVTAFREQQVSRKKFLHREGDVQKQVFFVTSGCLRSYAIDKNGFEHVLQFAPPGWWIADMKSAITGQPGNLNIDAIEDSEILTVTKAGLDELFISIPQLERFFRILAENALAAYQQRLTDNLSLPARDRYANFVALYPSLAVSLSQKQVASYIGVTPEFLSKMLNSK